MTMSSFWRSRRATTPVIAAVILAMFAFAPKPELAAGQCPVGYHLAGSEEARLSESDVKTAAGADQKATDARAQDSAPLCINDKHPETLEDLGGLDAQRAAVQNAPYGGVPDHAFSTAVAQKNALLRKGQDPVNSHSWQPLGSGPLEAADAGYGQVNNLGLVDLAGRITSFSYVPPTDRYLPDTLLASVSYGGVWASDSTVTRWVSIGNSLPTQVVGAVGYTPYGGGTIIALTGDGSFGADSREGAGAYYSTDFGRHWVHSTGIPDEAFGFKISVDKARPNLVYAATGSGLYRSTNGGRSFANVNLPTGPCAGKSNRVKPCLLANIVTDVVVMAPGGVSDEKTGKVLAAVGWRGGNAANPDGTIQSPNNGLYESDSGNPGSFKKVATTGFVQQDRIGRIELGEATGPDQDHNFVYALVQDAVLVREGLPGLDAPGFDFNRNCNEIKKQLPALPFNLPPCQMPTVLNGVYVSNDWGNTWVLMSDASELEVPGTGSALTPGEAVLGSYGPGVQSWYNEWIKPDPTLADPATGAPTRLLFGLEEVWENVNDNVPQIGPSAFHVIGRYFAGTQCVAILLQNLPACPTNGTEALLTETTTHPDQHDGIFIPTPEGVTLVVGNDGGAYKQTSVGGNDFNNAGWGNGANQGFNTLLPYDAVRAKDGTVW
ncbi:MAG: WD40/YVTN/BNR-like repeat-containing protein, partial [Actinomycetota bacterium]